LFVLAGVALSEAGNAGFAPESTAGAASVSGAVGLVAVASGAGVVGRVFAVGSPGGFMSDGGLACCAMATLTAKQKNSAHRTDVRMIHFDRI
jgi:hypothetical protein